MSGAVAIRRAKPADLAALIRLEQGSFTLDRQSPRSLAYLLTRAHALNWVAEQGGQVGAALIVLLRRRSRVARVYSIAVDASLRGQGVGREMLRSAEQQALQLGCRCMRCEVRADNRASRALFAAAGYLEFARTPEYYADGKTALRLQKRLSPSD